MIKLRSIARKFVTEVEQIAEDFLNGGDRCANGNLAADLFLQIGRGRNMIGVRMGLQQPVNGQPFLSNKGDELIGGGCRGAARGRIVIEHAIDDRAAFGRGIIGDMARREGRLVEEAFDDELRPGTGKSRAGLGNGGGEILSSMTFPQTFTFILYESV